MAEAAKAEAGGEQDLSMEEILQSIRRIISEDEDPNKPAAAAAAPADAKKEPPAAPPGSDVLELTEMVKDDGTVESLKNKPAEAAKPADSGDVLSAIDQAIAADKPAPLPPAAEAKPAAPPPPPAPTVESKPMETKPAAAAPASAPPADTVMSAEPAAVVADAFKKARTTEEPLPPLVTTPAPAFRSGMTVEDMVTDMLRPMMREWLDRNLPAIVERIVEREVRRLTK